MHVAPSMRTVVRVVRLTGGANFFCYATKKQATLRGSPVKMNNFDRILLWQNACVIRKDERFAELIRK